MPIPDYQSIMLPLLKFSKDGKEHSLREAIDFLSDQFALSDMEKKELLPSGQQAIFENRVGWARTYLKKAGLLDSTRRGFVCITARGLKCLAENPKEINVKYLKQFKEFLEFQSLRKDAQDVGVDTEPLTDQTPEESIESGYAKLRGDLSAELLQKIKNCSPDFFERLVVELLVKMGYGGSRSDAGKAIGKTGDGGIDGIIKEDKLGLDIVYIQAKRWDNSNVGRPDVQKFVGALQGQRARKGVFITTSSFSKEARDYVSNIDCKVVLIDGNELSSLLIENDIGVSGIAKYDIKKIDSDYFTDV
jgi:restriction system protein